MNIMRNRAEEIRLARARKLPSLGFEKGYGEVSGECITHLRMIPRFTDFALNLTHMGFCVGSDVSGMCNGLEKTMSAPLFIGVIWSQNQKKTK